MVGTDYRTTRTTMRGITTAERRKHRIAIETRPTGVVAKVVRPTITIEIPLGDERVQDLIDILTQYVNNEW